MSKFIKDILRDKNSRKYSITKSIAVALTILFLVIVSFSVIFEKPADYMLMGEILIAILTLTGFKNNFGLRERPTPPVVPPTTPREYRNRYEYDEGMF